MSVLRRRRGARKPDDPTLVLEHDFGLSSNNLIEGAARIGPVTTYSGNAGTSRIWDQNATLVGTTNNRPRFAHDPVTGAARGLLIEEQRENLCLRSEEFDVDGSGNPWTHTRSSVSADAIAAPDGNTTADELIEDGTGSDTHLVEQSISFTSGNAYTLTVFAKKNTRNNLRLTFATAAFPAGAYAVFNFDAGTVVSTGGGADSSSITDVGGGWYRASVTATADATASASVQIYLHNGTSITYNGDGSSGLYIWGSQVEVGALSTTYIPTTTAAVTRSADVNSTDISSIVASTMTIFFDGRTGYGAGVCMQLDDGTENERFRLEHNSSNEIRFFVTDGGVGLVDLNLGTVADNTDFKACMSVALNDVKGIITGGSEQTDTGVTMPTVDTLRYGVDTSGDELNGWIKRGSIWDVVKSSAFIAARVG